MDLAQLIARAEARLRGQPSVSPQGGLASYFEELSLDQERRSGPPPPPNPG